MRTNREEMLERQFMASYKNSEMILNEFKKVVKSYNRMFIALSCSVFVNVVLVLLGLLTK